jgi:hypothetical protein
MSKQEPEIDITIYSIMSLLQARYDFFVLNYGLHSGRAEAALTQADLKVMDQIEVEIERRVDEAPVVENPTRFSDEYWMEEARAQRRALRQHYPDFSLPERVSETHRDWLWPETWSW